MSSIYSIKEDKLRLIAYASLLNAGESTDTANIEAEMARIERIAEKYYIKSDLHYEDFMIKWLNANGRDIVYSDIFCYDEDIPDDYTELNINTFGSKKGCMT